mmetsp:Transcript_11901/g.20668  ORF Transcript_11901/g.20668 Transcript_11901/m.20668 type:complete len:416 (+) Transcript_11901:269-1516(+)|eukprot:CAMPEP_0183749838 /NCGR_PEP_ID=MMETSP0739-20130205/554_1 /TAXON_ID=385413 /ORGANISM="Thalassiosira miniscula, Strain CCMP1093" /LENGTH=415 /DNA_ID=CAMNT_0025985695 /DNA_START=177 /DNA_END=1424 /DNA_ORIENTATION=-
MVPFKYIDLLTLDDQNSRALAEQKIHLGNYLHEPSNEGDRAGPSQEQQMSQIQVNSTIDADIVLRRIVEDRAAILALKSRAATNEAELARAKARQLKITKKISLQDQEINKLTLKAKCDLADYDEECKKYIQSFMLAFENGDMDKLPLHPFAPPLEELEQAINRRQATDVEKVQVDDRIKKLEAIHSQERVATEVLQKNEEAFLRAIEISKQKFSEQSRMWRNRISNLLSNTTRQQQEFSHLNASPGLQQLGNLNTATEAQRTQVRVETPVTKFRYPPPPKYDSTPQSFSQAFNQPHQNEFTTFDASLKRPGADLHTQYRSMYSASQSPVACYPHLMPRKESPGHKRQKMERQPTPPRSPSASLIGKKIDPPDGKSDVDSKVYEKKSTDDNPVRDRDANDKVSMAHILTSLQREK